MRRQLGLDRPLLEQFLRYLGELARGDLGLSLTTGQPVLPQWRERTVALIEAGLKA